MFLCVYVFMCGYVRVCMFEYKYDYVVGVYKLHEKKVMFGQVSGHSRHYEGFFYRYRSFLCIYGNFCIIIFMAWLDLKKQSSKGVL